MFSYLLRLTLKQYFWFVQDSRKVVVVVEQHLQYFSCYYSYLEGLGETRVCIDRNTVHQSPLFLKMCLKGQYV